MQMSQLYHYQHEKLRIMAVVKEDMEFLYQCVPLQKSGARHPEYKYFIQPNSWDELFNILKSQVSCLLVTIEAVNHYF